MLISPRGVVSTVPLALTFITTEKVETDDSVLVDWICRFTPSDFRAAIRDTGCFLYRGEANDQAILWKPIPDLLLPETYGNDPFALEYFQCLENRLVREYTRPSFVEAKPSTGHIATSNPEEAGKWGHVVSVWPLGTRWSYVWPRDKETFFDDFQSAGCQTDTLVVDTDLNEALQQPREILFATSGLTHAAMGKTVSVSPSSFLAIPKVRDESIRETLEMLDYGLS